MSLPIGVALIGLFLSTSSIGILAGYVAVPSITLIVATMLGLGVGIDYALFILARHRQNLATGMPVPEAIARANATAGLSVLFAGAGTTPRHCATSAPLSPRTLASHRWVSRC